MEIVQVQGIGYSLGILIISCSRALKDVVGEEASKPDARYSPEHVHLQCFKLDHELLVCGLPSVFWYSARSNSDAKILLCTAFVAICLRHR